MLLSQWVPQTTGAGFDFTPILKPLEPFRDRLTLVSGLTAGPTVQNGGHAVAPASYLTGNIQPKQTEGSDILGARHRRSGDRQGDRPGHAVPVARSRDRGLQHLDRRLRHRLQLHLHEHHLVGGPDVAAADGDQPARACSSGCSAAPGTPAQRLARHAGEPQHPRRVTQTRRSRSTTGLGARDRALLDRLSRQRPRDRAAHRQRRGAGRAASDRPRRAGRPARGLRRARGADVRPDGGGVPGRRHPRVHVHDDARRHQPLVPAHRRARTRITRCRTRPTAAATIRPSR